MQQQKRRFDVWYKMEDTRQLELFPSPEIGPIVWYAHDSEQVLRDWEKDLGERYNTVVFPRVGKKWQSTQQK